MKRENIVEVIGRYIPLHKSGSRFAGQCPFCQDKAITLNVTPNLNFYKCFVCGAGGGASKFIREFDKLKTKRV